MRTAALLLLPLLAGCGEAMAPALGPDAPAGGSVDAAALAPDARTPADAPPAEDLDMALADFKSIPGFMSPAGRGYRVANLLGHEAAALAVASSPTGGTFPVGSVVEVAPSEVMVKRRAGWNATTGDWEYFRIQFAADGNTPAAFEVRGAAETACFMCHSMVSSPTWDFMCDHP